MDFNYTVYVCAVVWEDTLDVAMAENDNTYASISTLRKHMVKYNSPK